MGINNSGKTTVESYLEKMGFTRSISYTTRSPEVRNGVLETNGKEYRFVSEEKFMELVNKGIIIEYEKYGVHYYGTPVPYGATRFVAVVCLGGYRALKQKFGDQVIGVYLRCDRDTALKRAAERDENTEKALKRFEYEETIIDDMEKEAYIIINSNQELYGMLAEILKAVREYDR
jgi:guanylate kinase